MRTTVEISDEQRARLLEMAANRGEKGFSALVREAIDHYLESERRRSERVQHAVAQRRALDAEAADELLASVDRLRASWR